MEKIIRQKRALVIYLPVLHRGYLKLLRDLRDKVSKILVIDNDLVKTLSKYEPAISAMEASDTLKIIKSLGYVGIKIINEKDAKKFNEKSICLVNDEVSRKFYDLYAKKADAEWFSVFLRWDRTKVLSESNIGASDTSSATEVKFMKLAYKEGEKSSDWWRQVGAVLVRSGRVVLRGYNKGVPDDHTPYQVGALRDYMEVGERPEISSTIRGEQMIITEAAKKGLAVKGASLYVTHFPCTVCAKLIAASGIKECFFGEGSSNADGEKVLKSAGVKISKVRID